MRRKLPWVVDKATTAAMPLLVLNVNKVEDNQE
jgi:hypothetical protein